MSDEKNNNGEHSDNKKPFRDYDNARDEVKELYREQRKKQCICYVQRMHKKYLPSSDECEQIITMSIWNALQSLSRIIDKSDPDTTVPNIEHAFQTAEGIRNANLPDWMQLAGLLHDLGKVMYIKGCKEDGTDVTTQYGVVGDTYPIGFYDAKQDKLLSISHSSSLVYPEFNDLCECECLNDNDKNNQREIGFENCLFTFGHDEYLWQILKHNSRSQHCKLKLSINLPWEFMYIIRFHSFYAWHGCGAYSELSDFADSVALKKLKQFSSFDLYTKDDCHTCTTNISLEKLKPYYSQYNQDY